MRAESAGRARRRRDSRVGGVDADIVEVDDDDAEDEDDDVDDCARDSALVSACAVAVATAHSGSFNSKSTGS